MLAPNQQQTALEKAVMECAVTGNLNYPRTEGHCRLWNNGQGFPEDQMFTYWSVKDGMSMSWDNGRTSVPFWTDVVPCAQHLRELEDAANKQ